MLLCFLHDARNRIAWCKLCTLHGRLRTRRTIMVQTFGTAIAHCSAAGGRVHLQGTSPAAACSRAAVLDQSNYIVLQWLALKWHRCTQQLLTCNPACSVIICKVHAHAHAFAAGNYKILLIIMDRWNRLLMWIPGSNMQKPSLFFPGCTCIKQHKCNCSVYSCSKVFH